MFSILGAALTKFAPALAGPLINRVKGAAGEALQQVAIDTVQRTLGTNTDDEQVLAQAVENMTPEQKIALESENNKFEIELERLGVEVTRIHAQDRASAREREIKVGSGKIMPALAVGSMLIFAGACAIVLYLESFASSSISDSVLVGGIVGYASANVQTILSYFFGSSERENSK